jgi:ATP-dependent Clp protease ATP-binding subunit ClpC
VFDLFTDLARRSVLLGQDEAISLGHDFMGTEHLLLGLAGVPEGTAGAVLIERGATPDRVRAEAVRQLEAAGVPATGARAAADALAVIGIDVAEIQRRADETFGPGQFHFPRPAYTASARKALELTLTEAKALGHEYIGTEHMLLGVLAGGESIGLSTLTAVGVDPGELRAAIIARASAATP